MNRKAALIALVVLMTGSAGYVALTQTAHEHGATPQAHVYVCPMHPAVRQSKPGDCPICGMDLVPASPGPETSDPNPAPTGTRPLEGRAPVDLNAAQRQIIGLRTVAATERRLRKRIEAYGRVAYDPALYQAQEEYLGALEMRRSAGQSETNLSTDPGGLLEATRRRLRLLGLSDAQIDALRESDRADGSLLMGAKENERSWIYADVYEEDVPLVRPGQTIEVTSPAFPGRTFSGRIVSINPTVDPTTRTVRVRARADEAAHRLKPESYVNVTIQADLGIALAVPRSAVLDTGAETFVFVDQGGGRFHPSPVEIGRRAGDDVEILAGLDEGARVVVDGNFLLDSESQLRGAAGGSAFYKGREAAE